MMFYWIAFFSITFVYFMKDLFPKNPNSHVAFFIAAITTLWWFFMHLTQSITGYFFDALVCLSTGAIIWHYLIHEHYISGIKTSIRHGVTSAVVCGWVYFICQGVSYIAFPQIALPSGINFGLAFLFIISVSVYLYRYMGLLLLPTWVNAVKFHNIMSIGLVMSFSMLLASRDFYSRELGLLWFYIIIGLFIVPIFLFFRILFVRLYIRTCVFTVLFSWLIYYSIKGVFLLDGNGLNTPYKVIGFFWVALLYPMLFYGYEQIIRYLDKHRPFSILNIQKLTDLVMTIKKTDHILEIQQLLNKYSIFSANKRYRQYLVLFNHSGKVLGEQQEGLRVPEEILLVLSTLKVVHLFEIEHGLIKVPSNITKESIKKLVQFMKDHQLLRIALLKSTRRPVGVYAISGQVSSNELLEYDQDQLTLFESILSNTINNIFDAEELRQHQYILEYINVATSKFSISMNDEVYYSIIRRSIQKIVPSMKHCFYLTWDKNSQFYKRSFRLSKTNPDIDFKISGYDMDRFLGEKKYVQLKTEEILCPIELKKEISNLNTKSVIFIRTKVMFGGPIFVVLLEKEAVVAENYGMFCYMFLCHAEVFYDYQTYSKTLTGLQDYLKRLLDNIPIGIMITNAAFELTYINKKMEDELAYPFSKYIHEKIVNIPFQEELLETIVDVSEQKHEITRQAEIPINNRYDLYLIHSFIVYQDTEECVITVLTNIQQSKELFKQMNQSNRLAMMSKVAVGISYELEKPVSTLTKGIQKISKEWKNQGFQQYFNTDIVPQVDRINLLCQSLLRLSRSDSESLVEVSLQTLLDQVLRLIGGEVAFSRYKFNIAKISKKTIIVDQVMVVQVLTNLVVYCFKKMVLLDSNITLDLSIQNVSTLRIQLKIKEYRKEGFVNQKNVTDQLELSIINHIVSNQNGRFNIIREQNIVFFIVQLPIQPVTKIKDTKEAVTEDRMS
jgi:nitrogen-specific signal transduction histidine kinase